VFNMQVTSNRGVAVNPNDPSQVVIANTDFVVLESNSRFENDDITRDRPDDSESRGYDVIFDTRANQLILGSGNRDANDTGEVFLKSTSDVGEPQIRWFDTELRLATANGGRARAVAYGYHNGTSSTSQTILAAVEGEGIYRYHNGSWSKANGVSIGSTDRSNLVWPDSENSGVVYLVDFDDHLSFDPRRHRSRIPHSKTVQSLQNDGSRYSYIRCPGH